jgi:hypothetical protein
MNIQVEQKKSINNSMEQIKVENKYTKNLQPLSLANHIHNNKGHGFGSARINLKQMRRMMNL